MGMERSMKSGASFVKLFAFIILALLMVMTGPAAADAESIIIYVDADATGEADGLSWEDAYTSLQEALDVAVDGDQIWVAAGTYYPVKDTAGNDSPVDPRALTFQMKNGVAIYGGFAGNEVDLDGRDYEVNETILSGDLGIEDDPSDNSYHVFNNSGIDGTAILDGFTITGGNANNGDSSDYGGGMYNFGSGTALTNVTFRDNSAYAEGGGMYNKFSNHLTLTNVTFSGNTAGYGGGLYNYNSSLELTDVIFSGNSARGSGGGMFNLFSSSLLTEVTFSGNSAGASGGGFLNSNDSSSTLTKVTFTDNEAGESGGGMAATGNPVLNQVTFSGNTANYYGGGLHFEDSGSPELTDVTFSENYAGYTGGGLHNYKSSPTLTAVTFSGNSAGGEGGGMYNNDNSSPALTNAAFIENSADLGGGIFNNNSSPTLTNVTFSGNSANVTGGGLFNNNSNNPKITNCIFWGNAEGQIYDVDTKSDITFSLIQDYAGGGEGNISDDPLFVSEEDLSLKAGSPAIDAGTNTPFEAGGAAYGVTADLYGNPRIANDTVDMGAYEYPQYYQVTFAVATGKGTVNAQVDGEPLETDALVVSGTEVSFAAVPASGWRFVKWDINGTPITESSPEVTVDSDINAVAYFEQRPSHSGSSDWSPTINYSLTMETEGHGTTNPIAGTYSYREGTMVTLTACPQAGWEFTKWLISGEDIFDSETRVRIDKNTTAIAYFTEIAPAPADPAEIILTIGSKVILADGQEVLMDVAPYIDPDASRTMVPIRFVSEALGADVQWQPENNQAKIVLDDQKILLTIGSKTVYVNGTAAETDSPAVIRDSRTFVPLRFISETLGAEVVWNNETRQITIIV
ncbi:MAG TPA: stalk domain-containing protein [Syntrophomonadaceae bacterium]|nr:stalk domain-containing protein [Syntrophomonadaceae bacterium]HPR94630.1 stalk domain-containing protein [Syntrophomonadaceae bacterium]